MPCAVASERKRPERPTRSGSRVRARVPVRVRVRGRVRFGLRVGFALRFGFGSVVVASDLEVVIGGDGLLHELLGNGYQLHVCLGGDARVVPGGVITR